MLLLIDPTFSVLTKSKKSFFRFSVQFKVILMVFAIFCHQLDHIHVKGNFILFTMTIESP